MSGIDRNKAEQVWQRVRGESQQQTDRLPELMQELAGLYTVVNRKIGAGAGELQTSARRDFFTLRGIARMQGRTINAPRRQQPGEHLLAECCRRELELMKALEKAEGEYTPIYEQLYENACARCARGLALIGNQER